MERTHRAPVGTFYAPGTWGAVVALDEAAAHHAQVKRVATGDVVRLTSGDGRRALGTLAANGKRHLAVEIDVAAIETVPAPSAIALFAPIGDRDRMLMLAEKCVELGLSAWQPVRYHRSRSVSPRGEGEAFREKLRLRMVAALEQSGGAWLPAIAPECSPGDACASTHVANGFLLTQSAPRLHGLLPSVSAPCALAIGPEGGFEAAERDEFVAAGWRPASLGDNVLRFETAGIAALAIVRAHFQDFPS